MVRRELAERDAGIDRIEIVDDRDNAIRLVERGGGLVLMPSFWAPIIPAILCKVSVPWMHPLDTGWIVRRWDRIPSPAVELAARYRVALRVATQDPYVELLDEVA
jgi:hypothetical protein